MNGTDVHTCAAFTGHRTCRREADALLLRAVAELHAAGVRTFLSGMAGGFDLAAAEAVLAFRAAHPGVRLTAVVPFRGQERRFPPRDRARFERILRAADEVLILAEHYHPACYHARNDFLVAHAATLVTWYDGSAGGTRYTVERALACGRRIVHLHPQTPAAVLPLPELFP